MSGFVASQRLSQLNYDFGDFAPTHLRPMRGTVPEPSRAAVLEFNDTLARGLESLGLEVPDPTDRIRIAQLYSKLTIEQLHQLNDRVLDAIAAVTENTPPREHLEQLGARAIGAFQDWLQKELNSPEAPSGATSR